MSSVCELKMTSFKSVFVTGSNRGIGLEFVKQLLKLSSPPKVIFAACRNQSDDSELNTLAKGARSTTVHVVKLDVCNEADIEKAVSFVGETVGPDGLAMLINNAGFYDKSNGNNVQSETIEKLRTGYEVNAIGPFLVSRAFLRFLKTAGANADSKKPSLLVSIGSNLGSINLTTDATGIHYKMSKAALHMMTKTFANHLSGDNVLSVSLHPGWVQTDMGGSAAPLTVQKSVSAMLEVIRSLDSKHDGCLVDYKGAILPF